jgi:glycosyltransferase involved in cell wall biosynthesis
MKILYSALDQTVPGTTGGSVHVAAVASGLAELGHDVHVLTQPGAGGFPRNGAHWHALGAPFGLRHLRLLRSTTVAGIARAVRPEIVLERYHNFGGEGVRAARSVGARMVLEVNAPIVDYPGSPKARLDCALIAAPLRRWRDWQCRHADLFVTPTAAILPTWIPQSKIVEVEWGADTDRFHPGAAADRPDLRIAPHEPGAVVAVFAGAFRTWHGAIDLVRAIATLRARGRRDIRAVLIGSGPEWAAVRDAAGTIEGVVLTGAIAHDEMPAHLAAADIGVAPFDVKAHAPLMLEFYWSPLKVFEYMASGLPVVAPAIPRLQQLVADGREGVFYDPSRPNALADAIEWLADPAVRRPMAEAARRRAVRDFSWKAHCRRLDAAFRELAKLRSGFGGA